MADPRPLPPALPHAALLESWANSPADATRLLLLDYDGTLSPHVNDPEDAIATPYLLRVLSALAADPRNALWVISGRPGDFLERQLGAISGIGISCEHGGFTREPGTTEWVGTGMYESDLKETWIQAKEILEKHVKRLDGAFIEYKKSSFTFAYRMAPKDLAPTVIEELQADLQSLLASVPRIVIKQGVYVIEVRPVGVDKGEIAKGLIARYPRIGFSLAAGDEGTDEDMFAALHTNIEDGRLPGESVWTLFVNGIYGLRSCAKYMVGGVPDAIGVLAELAGVKE